MVCDKKIDQNDQLQILLLTFVIVTYVTVFVGPNQN